MQKVRIYIVFFLATCFTQLVGQRYIHPSKIKNFNITVNREDHTVKSSVLSKPKPLNARIERTYLWYSTQEVFETKGGYHGRLLHGTYKSFYLNGQLREEGRIKLGLRQGQWKYWYPDGNIKELVDMKNGMKHGNYSLYNGLGGIIAKGKFKRDKLHGRFFTYDHNGKVVEKSKYRKGREVKRKASERKRKRALNKKKLKEPTSSPSTKVSGKRKGSKQTRKKNKDEYGK